MFTFILGELDQKPRYLANMRTREVHDLQKVTGRCHIDRIKMKQEFRSLDAARLEQLDFCAHCLKSEY